MMQCYVDESEGMTLQEVGECLQKRVKEVVCGSVLGDGGHMVHASSGVVVGGTTSAGGAVVSGTVSASGKVRSGTAGGKISAMGSKVCAFAFALLAMGVGCRYVSVNRKSGLGGHENASQVITAAICGKRQSLEYMKHRGLKGHIVLKCDNGCHSFSINSLLQKFFLHNMVDQVFHPNAFSQVYIRTTSTETTSSSHHSPAH